MLLCPVDPKDQQGIKRRSGIDPIAAAGFLALIGVFDLVGTIGSGWLSDRFDTRHLLHAFYGLRGLSLIFLPFSNFSILQLSVFAVFYGLDWVATVPPTVKLSAANFGPEKAPMVFGWIFMGHHVGAAAAANAAGVVRTDLGTYMRALFAAGILCLLAAVAMLGIRRRVEPADYSRVTLPRLRLSALSRTARSAPKTCSNSVWAASHKGSPAASRA